MLYYVILLFLSVFSQASEGYNILGIFPHHGFSHFKVFHPLIFSLAEKGHRVTVITHIKSPEEHENYEELLLTGKPTINLATISEFEPKRTLKVLLEEFFALSNEGYESCELLYNSGFPNTILERHKTQPYDLIITEFFNADCQLGIASLLKLPVIGISSCALMPWYYDRITLPDFPSFVQSEFIGFPEKLNWKERAINFIQFKLGKFLYRYYTNYRDREIIKRHLGIDINVNEVAKAHTSIIFVNQHFSLSGTRPLNYQYIEVGGLHLNRGYNQILDNNLRGFVERSKNGVILISWGSVLRSSSIAPEKLNAIITVLNNQPFDVIWKWESDVKPIESDKFLFLPWVEQSSLLAHPNVKLFWTHGGLLGTTEAVNFGKPLIVTPFYGDQFLNAHAVENRNIGRIICYQDISIDNLMNVFEEVSQKFYEPNVKRISKLFNDRPAEALDTAVWWTEFIMKHQNASDILKSMGMELNWFIYYSLDSIIIMIFSFVLPIWITFLMFKMFKKQK